MKKICKKRSIQESVSVLPEKSAKKELQIPDVQNSVPNTEHKNLPSENLQNPPNPQEQQATKTKDSRIPPVGSIISKTYRGQQVEVKVLENGFEYKGKVYKSISRVAMTITKRQISGYVFFGLSKWVRVNCHPYRGVL